MSENYDEDGFEIPEEYWPLSTTEEQLMCLSLGEYNRMISIDGESSQRLYYIMCVKRHLEEGRMSRHKDIKSTIYDPDLHALIVAPGYELDLKNFTMWKSYE